MINGENLIFKKLKYNLSIFEKFKIIYLLFITEISDIYILTPKNFYYYLPYLFRKIKFHALCINGRKDYKRPNEYLRKFLYKFVINNRAANYKRAHTSNLQNQLITNNKNINCLILDKSYLKNEKIMNLKIKKYFYTIKTKSEFNKFNKNNNLIFENL